MYLVGASLAAPRPASPLAQPSAVVSDLVWLLATAADGLEHVRVRTSTRQVIVVLFLRGTSVRAAVEVGQGLCERLVAAVPFLAGWQVDGCWSLEPPEGRPEDSPGWL